MDEDGSVTANMVDDNDHEQPLTNLEIVTPIERDDHELPMGDGDDTVEEGDDNVEEDDGLIDEVVDISSSLLGIKAKTWKGLHKLYLQHSKSVGFSARISTTRTIGGRGGIVTEKNFVCSCEGKTNSGTKVLNSSTDDRKRKQRIVLHTRVHCKAAMKVKKDKDGNFVVTQHIVAHNHPLTPPEWQHHHRSERQIPPEEGDVIQMMTEARLPTCAQFRYLATCCGGEEFVGHTKKDHYNFVGRLKMKMLAGGDAQTVIDMLQKRATEEPSFYYKVKLDAENRVQNIFWRDGMMKEDYLLYHDVVIFDTTYRTNKYNLICAPFVGVNNHWANVMFGCAFLSDEKTESFEWLFNTFNESMGGNVYPTSIFTDQDQAMSSAIEKVFQSSRHRLCQWHIQQNAMSHFGSLKHDSTFQNVFNKCLRGCSDEVEFEQTWSNMIRDYGLEGNAWFDRLYGIRMKWSTAFSKDFFSAGILSSQRSESTNHAIGFQANKTTSLTDFYGIFTDTVKRWRSEEQKNEFQCSRSMPSSTMSAVGLIKSAASVYTVTLFQRFEQEFVSSLGTNAFLMGTEDSTKVYKICPSENETSYHIVTFDSASNFITCSCRKFEEVGLLCFHCLRVLHLSSVTDIPERYILKRWSRYAKSEVWDRLRDQTANTNSGNQGVAWRRQMLCNFHSLILQCQGSKEGQDFMDQIYSNAASGVHSLFADVTSSQAYQSSDSNLSQVLDPVRAITKGRNARTQRQPKPKKSSNKRQKSSAQTNVVSFTPLPRLI